MTLQVVDSLMVSSNVRTLMVAVVNNNPQCVIKVNNRTTGGDELRFEVGTKLNLAATSISDPDQHEVTVFKWDMDDGYTRNGKNVEYTYDIPGYYNVTLLIKDEYGASENYTFEVTIYKPHEPEGKKDGEKEAQDTGIWLMGLLIVVILIVVGMIAVIMVLRKRRSRSYFYEEEEWEEEGEDEYF